MPAKSLIMVRPACFGSNPETQSDNVFQQAGNDPMIGSMAIKEFDKMVQTLKDANVEVMVLQDPGTTATPDSIFPNNWFSTHEDGKLILYPMKSMARRQERRPQFIDKISNDFNVIESIDLSSYEKYGSYLEGTGTMVLDHEQSVAYVCQSDRYSREVLDEFCTATGYTPCVFEAEMNGKPVYHTNVMMSVGSQFIVACTEIIVDPKGFEKTVEESGKELIIISKNQVNAFLGNCLEIKNNVGESILVLSSQAYKALNDDQKNSFTKFVKLLPAAIPTIEKYGGGSVRCMIAENYLTKINTND